MAGLNREEIKSVHLEYRINLALWKLYMAAYKGIDAIVRGNYIPQHEREPDIAYTRRIKDLYSFAYSKSVSGIFTYHLLNKPPQGRKLQKIEKNEFWTMFFKDANLYGDSYDATISSLSLNASIQGHMGILIDKSPVKFKTIKEQKDAKVYPYIAAYHPPAILDWKFEKDEFYRPYLSYLKLLDEDGRYRIWTKDTWAVYEITDSEGRPEAPNVSIVSLSAGSSNSQITGAKAAPGSKPIPVTIPSSRGEVVEPISQGDNKLGFIPFIWYYNLKTDKQGIGESDLSEIARIDISLVKNASQIEEIINFAAFPMLMKPKRDADPKKQALEQDDEVSVQSVVEYDPEYPESKPEWLTPEVEKAISSILKTMEHKVGEIYRSANIGGLAGTEVSTQAKSGVALKAEFQILNSILVAKSMNLEKAENKILEYWLKWEEVWDKYKEEVNFGRSKSFNVEDVAADLENALTAKTIVMSKTFNGLLQKQTAKQVLPSMSEDDQNLINQEIDDAVDKMPEPGESTTGEIDDEDNPGTRNIIDKGMKEDDEE